MKAPSIQMDGVLAEITASPTIIMAATASFVLITMGLSATITASKIAK